MEAAGDIDMGCKNLKAVQTLSIYQPKVYFYRFDHDDNLLPRILSTAHALDTNFAFDSLDAWIGMIAKGDFMKYEPTKKSVSQHQCPEWFHDAKFGIFIHWGPASVPAYAPVSDRDIWEVAREEGMAGQMKNNPYAEWYLNTMKIEGSPTQKYHRQTYGEDFSYFNFASMFNEEIKKWDPAEWADIFKEAGARYLVFVSKHHDGFLMWPSERQNPYHEKYCASRDIVGELAEAARARDIRMGVYYSGGLDWTFQTEPIVDAASGLANGSATREYADYVEFHLKELIDRYHPSILWNDICYPPAGDPFEVFAYYYNHAPEGAVNSRWNKFPRHGRKAMLSWPLRQIINFFGDKLMASGLPQAAPPHADFDSAEYADVKEIQKQKWESVRGIGHSFAYNRMETADQFLKPDETVRMLVDVVSKNGNLTLNVGPRADGSIQEEQLACLRGIGEWLRANGEAIYGTRPWVRAEGKTTDGIEVRFTRKGDTLYAFLLDTPEDEAIVIKGLSIKSDSSIRMLDPASELEWRQGNDGVVIELPEKLSQSPAHALAITPAP